MKKIGKKTAFTTRFVLYQFKVMPFSDCVIPRAPGGARTFTTAVVFMLIYFNVIIILSKMVNQPFEAIGITRP